MRELIDSMAQTNDPTRVICHDQENELDRCQHYEIKTADGGNILDIFFNGHKSSRAGVTNECLLRVVMDRLRPSPGKSSEKLETARKHIKVALMLLRDDFNEPWVEATPCL